MNWRRGFKRVAALYVIVAGIAVVGSLGWNVSQVDCPTEYHYTADQMRRAAVTRQLEAKAKALRGKCEVMSASQRATWEATERARKRLNLPEPDPATNPFAAAFPDLPPCPADALKLDPIPYSDTIAHTYVVPRNEVLECWVDPWNWHLTKWVAIWAVLIPVTAALMAAIGFGLFRLGHWLYRGFRAD